MSLVILPGVKSFSSGVLNTPHYGMSGQATWTLHQNGNFSFSGDVSNSSSETYGFAVVSNVKDSSGAVIGTGASGKTDGGTNFSISGSDPKIHDAWIDFFDTSVKFDLSVSTDIGEIIGGVVGGVATYILIAGVYLGAAAA